MSIGRLSVSSNGFSGLFMGSPVEWGGGGYAALRAMICVTFGGFFWRACQRS